LRNKLSLVIRVIAVALSLSILYQSIFGQWTAYLSRSLLLTTALVLLYLVYPLSKKKPESRLLFGVDIFLALLAALIGVYMAVNNLEIVTREGIATRFDLFLGGILTLLILEAVRRTVGWALVVIIAVLLGYTLLGPYMPGFLIHPGSTLKIFLDYNITTFDGFLGIPVAVMVTYIYIYVILASLMIEAKTPEFFKNFSYAVMGRQTGGLGKVAVMSSAIMGSISGSATANVMTTGSYTIPAMKEAGYPPVLAGAIEASASTGGQFMPPIMSAAGFLMAAFLGLPYLSVALAAAVPAMLYFISVGVSVHAISAKHGLRGLTKEEIPKTREVLKRLHLLSPLIVLVVALFLGYSANRAGFYAIIAAVVVSYFSRETMLTPKSLIRGLEKSARSVLSLTATCASAGIIVILVLISGLAMKMPFLISRVSGDSVLAAALIVALTVVVLSVGLPSTAGYVIGATLMAPVLINQYGVSPIAAHFFVLYFAVMANVTPPVAMASYAAASLAGTSLWTTSIRGFFLSLSGFIIPFLFLREPALLLDGTVPMIILSILIALMDFVALALAIFGYFHKKIPRLFRVILFIVPAVSIVSYYLEGYHWLNIVAFCGFAAAIVGIVLGEKLRGAPGMAAG
jgi:TRAP transporter 4TM/12TM fusion protein